MTTTRKAAKPTKGTKKEKTEITLSKSWDIRILPRKFELTSEQKYILKVMADDQTKVVFMSGVAGTAKSYTSILAAVRALQENKELDLLYLRSVVESSARSMGFLPGELEEKLSPYLIPLEDKLVEIIPVTDIEYLKKGGRINAMPINFLRGASWTNKIIVVDEAQNMTTKELLTIMTRLGEGAKLFICGDPYQADIHNSGFQAMVELFDDAQSQENGVSVFRLTEDNVVRSEILKFILHKTKSLRIN